MKGKTRTKYYIGCKNIKNIENINKEELKGINMVDF